MKKILISFALLGTLATSALADYWITGDYESPTPWTGAGNIMTDMGGGIWQVSLTMSPGRHEFKVTQGDWSWNVPGSGNSWLFTDGSGNITITYDVNTYSDGWHGDGGRIGLSTDPGTWTAAGDWQGWNNAGNSMVSLGGGIYQYQQVLAPGWYQYKAVVTGSWDAIGNDFRSVNADNTWFEVTADNPLAVFEVNALAGTERVYTTTIPEPSTFALLGIALAGFVSFRRRQ